MVIVLRRRGLIKDENSGVQDAAASLDHFVQTVGVQGLLPVFYALAQVFQRLAELVDAGVLLRCVIDQFVQHLGDRIVGGTADRVGLEGRVAAGHVRVGAALAQ